MATTLKAKAAPITIDLAYERSTKGTPVSAASDPAAPVPMMTAMRATFQSTAARGVRATYELRLGDIVLHLGIADSKLAVTAGPLPGADLVIQSGPAIKMLLSGELSAHDAVAQGLVKVTGDPALLEQFSRMFRIGVLGHGATGNVAAERNSST
jgi:hypothetical protein